MRVVGWLLVSVVVLVVVGSASCGQVPLYTCPDPSHPCEEPDAGTDGGADAADQ